MDSLKILRACFETVNRSCRRLPRRSAAKTGEPAGEASFANRPHAFTGVATSRFMESLHSLNARIGTMNHRGGGEAHAKPPRRKGVEGPGHFFLAAWRLCVSVFLGPFMGSDAAWHRIVSATSPRMAPANPLERKKNSEPWAVCF